MEKITNIDDINLIQLVKLFWKEKWKIILFVLFSCLIGIYINFSKEKEFEISIIVDTSTKNISNHLKSGNLKLGSYNNVRSLQRNILMNKIAEDINAISDKINISPYSSQNYTKYFDPKFNFKYFNVGKLERENQKMFSEELNDKEKIREILKSNNYIKKKINGKEKEEQNEILSLYSKKVKFLKPIEGEKKLTVKMVWHDVKDAENLLKKIILKSNQNVEKKINAFNSLTVNDNINIKNTIDKETKILLSFLPKNEKLEKKIISLSNTSEYLFNDYAKIIKKLEKLEFSLIKSDLKINNKKITPNNFYIYISLILGFFLGCFYVLLLNFMKVNIFK